MKCDHPSCDHNVVAPGMCGVRLCPRNNPSQHAFTPVVGTIFEASRELVGYVVEALAPIRDCLVLIGAHAVYLHTSGSDLSIGATSDTDFAVDPRHITPDTQRSITEMLTSHGFEPLESSRPGQYEFELNGHHVQLDLLVPETLAGAGGKNARGARLSPPNSKRDAGRATGIELAVIDHTEMLVGNDPPQTVNVAGPAAIIIAKAHKIGERTALSPRRVAPKDVADIAALTHIITPKQFNNVIDHAVNNPLTRTAAQQGITHLHQLFEHPYAIGYTIAANAYPERDKQQQAINSIETFMSGIYTPETLRSSHPQTF